MLPSYICPSMMCVDYSRFGDTVKSLEQNGADFLHIDIMDGVFVKNYTLGTDFCKNLRKITSVPLDIHLMITEPEWKIDWFDVRPGEYVSVHAESTNHLQRALAAIKARGAHPVAALNPATPLNILDYVMEDIDAVLLMTVNPGFAGQKLIPECLRKIKECRSYLDNRGYRDIRIEVDGNVSFENARIMRMAGADMFVCGTSSVFSSGTLDENMKKVRDCVL